MKICEAPFYLTVFGLALIRRGSGEDSKLCTFHQLFRGTLRNLTLPELGKWFSADLLLRQAQQDAQEALSPLVEQARLLGDQYDCVVANPPYMGGKWMNGRLGPFIKKNFPASKSDMMTAFIERCISFGKHNGRAALVTLDSWMFLTSFRKMREDILSRHTVSSMAHVGWNCFPDGHTYNRGTTFVIEISSIGGMGVFLDLSNVPATFDKSILFKQRNCSNESSYYMDSADFAVMPEHIMAYWATDSLRNVFSNSTKLAKLAAPRQGLATADNDRFTRLWAEVSFKEVGREFSNSNEAAESQLRWFPYNKGGEYRKWYGNQTHIIDWKSDGSEIKNFQNAVVRNPDTYFRPCVSWSKVTSAGFSLRYFPAGFIYDVAGCSIFLEDPDTRISLMCLINSEIMNGSIKRLSPTINLEVGQIAEFPVIERCLENLTVISNGHTLLDIAKNDWNASEISWYFIIPPVLSTGFRTKTLISSFESVMTWGHRLTSQMQCLEEENNRYFIEAYGLQDELTPDVPLSEITLTCNPHYRYGGNLTDEEREARMKSDTMRELVSYAIGCMMGRYSLAEPGLIYAHAGGMSFDSSRYGPFPADDDGIIPMTEEQWFADDAAARIGDFLGVAWPDAPIMETMTTLMDGLAMGNAGEPRAALRSYGRDQTRSHSFPVGGTVALGCNIHDQMRGYIRVVDTPFAAKTDQNGLVRLSGMAAGGYQMTIWHARARTPGGELKRALAVGAGANSQKIAVKLR